MRVEICERQVRYYDVTYKERSKYRETDHLYKRCFAAANTLVEAKDRSRYIERNGYNLFFGLLKTSADGLSVRGTLYKVRNDIMPRVIDLTNENVSDLDIGEEKGLVETTHFIIDCRRPREFRIAIEYNHYGARIADFQYYLNRVGNEHKMLFGVLCNPITRDRLESVITRMGRIKKYIVRAHRSNVSQIKELNQNLGTAIESLLSMGNMDYVTIEFSADLESRPATTDANNWVTEWVRKFINRPPLAHLFDRFRVEMEDEENDNTLDWFDLLIDHEHSTLYVEKKAASRMIISEDMFLKMLEEYHRKFA